MQFVTEVEIADEFGNVEIVEVITELPPAVAKKAQALAAQFGGYKSHNQIVIDAARAG